MVFTTPDPTNVVSGLCTHKWGDVCISSTQPYSIPNVHSKSLERSPAVGDFYGTRIEIWPGFGPVRQLLRPVFFMFS